MAKKAAVKAGKAATPGKAATSPPIQGPGVITTLIDLLKAGGGSPQELYGKLAERFPDRASAKGGMRTTVNIQLKRLHSRPLRHLPIGRGRGVAADVQEDPDADRSAAGAAGVGMSRLGLNARRRGEDCVLSTEKLRISAPQTTRSQLWLPTGLVGANFVASARQ